MKSVYNLVQQNAEKCFLKFVTNLTMLRLFDAML